jgi:PAS domain S-box-containing protein
VTAEEDDEDKLLRSVALQNTKSVLLARQRAEQALREAQSALRESNERLQLALAAGHLGDWTWDVATDEVSLSERAARIFGFPRERVVTWATLRERLHEDDRERARAAVDEALAKRADYNIEYRVRVAPGELRWVAAHGRGTYTPDGAVARMTGIVQDVTAHKREQDALSQSQARLQMAVEAGQMGDWEWDIAHGKVHWSPGLEALHGLAPGMFGGTFEDFQRNMHTDDRERVLAAIAHCLEERGDYRVEYRIVKPDGAVAWIEARGKLVVDTDDQPQRMTGICMDITSRKQAEEALRDETRVLEILNDTGAMLSQKLELQALVQAVTDAATALSGARFGAFFYNVTNDSGDSFMLYALSGAPREAFQEIGQPRATPLFGPTFHGAGPIRSADVLADSRYGKWGPHHGMPPGHLPVRSYLAVPVISRSGEVIGGLFFGHPEVGVFTERAERLVVGVAAQAAVAIDNARMFEAAQRAAEDRKRLLDSERVARAAAERMSEMKDQFLATLSHELRTPLSAILGWSQVLRRRGVKDDADVQRGLETIERNARMQTQLIEDLLDMSRIASGKVRLDVQMVQPAALVEAANETVRPAADAKNIALLTMVEPNVGAITGDPGRLQQVVWNLLSNAIKFTPKDGRIETIVRREADHVEIRVTDTGIGIKPEFLAHLFERFRQADASTTRKYGGLGLGLSIVKNLVELHGGSVHAQSEGKDRGATFIVQLPARPAESERPARARIAPILEPLELASLDLSGIKVLIVDDDTDSRELIEHVLSDCAAEVIATGSATEALALVQRHHPDVLVSDIGMPDLDGFELLRRIRALGSECGGDTPAIALTAFARTEDRRRAVGAGYSVHLAKPVEASKLIATVASVAGRHSEASTG